MKQNYFFKTLLLLLCLVGGVNVSWADEIDVTTSNFAEKLAAATDGDILVLAAGTYTSDIALPASAKITLKAATDAEVILQNKVRATDGACGSLTFKNLKIKSSNDVFIDLSNAGDIDHLSFDGCNITGNGDNYKFIIRNGDIDKAVDAISFNKCIIHDMGNGYRLIDITHQVKSFACTNSTIYNYNGDEFFYPNTAYTGVFTFTFNNNTVYKFGASNKSVGILYVDNKYNNASNTFTFKDNIFWDNYGSNVSAYVFYSKTGAGTVTQANNVLYNFDAEWNTGSYTKDYDNLSYSGTIPFQDAANADFGISPSHTLATTSTTGGVVGDPDWLLPSVNWTLSVNREDWGSAVSDHTAYLAGESATVTATPSSSDYLFKEWQNGEGNQLSIDNPYTFEIDEDMTVKAVFELNTSVYQSWPLSSASAYLDLSEGRVADGAITSSSTPKYDEANSQINGIPSNADANYPDKAYVEFKVRNTTENYYTLNFYLDWANSNDYASVVTVTVTDDETGETVTQTFNAHEQGNEKSFTITNGKISAGYKTVRFAFNNNRSNCNFKNVNFTVKSYDKIPGTLTLANGSYNNNGMRVADSGDEVGWIKNGSYATYYFDNTLAGDYKLAMEINKSKDGSMNVKIEDVVSGDKEVDHDYVIPSSSYGTPQVVLSETPLTAGLKKMTLTFTSENEGYLCNYKAPTLSALAKVNGVTVAGQDVTTSESSDWYCALPVIYDATTTFAVNSVNGTLTVTAKDESSTSVSVTDNGDGTYTIDTPETGATTTVTIALAADAGCYEHKTSYTFNIFRNSPKTVNLKANEGTIASNTWSNGSYSMATTNLGKYNEYFKTKGTSYTISLPSDVVVTQMTLKGLRNNYPGKGASVSSVTSTGATASLPGTTSIYHSDEGASYDLVVPISGHSAGQAVNFTITATNPSDIGEVFFWIELLTTNEDPGTAPLNTDDNVTIVNNHAVVAVTFDREIANDVTASINGGTVTAEGGAATLYFPVWNLSYSTNYTLTIAANAVEDNYGNKNSEAIEIAVNTDAKPTVTQDTYDYVVSNATELDDAIAALKVSNNTAAAARKTVFLKNGSYTYATLTGSYQYNVSLKIDNWNDIYNVSLIGESKDGVIIEGTTDGITSATLNLGNGTGIYLQDMTIRNNYDYPTADKGVSVAVTGGNMAVLKNVAMQACQDTYVTGKRTYLENCDISGTVDFICGGGDIFFNQCNLILLYRPEDKNDVIVAPNTTADTKWGYVFQYCTINAKEGENVLAEKNYYLGRPWQNEPRCYYLNTTMNVLPNNDGWASMGKLPTHFYEYNSMNSGGDALDLSVRKNSPTSTNSYTPVLSAGEAAKYTLKNVLGGTDSWLPTDECPTLDAPASVSMSGTTLSWDAVSDARCYVIFKDGEYYANQTETSIALTEAGTYTVKAANLNGGLGAESPSKTYVILDQAVSYVASASTNTSITLTRTIAADKWSTIVLPCDLTSDQIEGAFGASVQVAELSSLSDDVLHFSSVTSMNANEPYIIMVAKDFSSATINGVTIEEGTPSKTTVSGVDFVGSYDAVTEIPASDGDYTYYFISNNALYSTASSDTSNKMRGMRAYFKVPGSTAARQLSFVVDEEGGEATGVSAALNDKGKMTNDKVVYDLQGRKVAQPTNGLYIVNGKKVLVP